MSGLYIPGMEMPKDGEMLVLCVGYNGKVLHPIEFSTEDFLFADTGKTAIELHPHGRLIDADALNLDYEVEMADDWKTAHEIANVVKYAPAIIPADGGDT